MKIFNLIFFLFFSYEMSYSQPLNIACLDFTFEKKKSIEGSEIRKIFESVAAKSSSKFKVLEREQMPLFFEKLQEEKNLFLDLNKNIDKDLQLAGVDYVVFGDISVNFGVDKYRLNISFLKIAGKNVTQKLPFILTFTKEELSDYDIVEKRLSEEFKKFEETYFVFSNQTAKWVEVPDFIRELDKRDSLLRIYQVSLQEKEKNIARLDSTVLKLNVDLITSNRELLVIKNDIVAIKEYTDIATINMFGLPSKFAGSSTIQITSPLSILMEKVFVKNSNSISFKNDSEADSIINEVIKRYPKFPFGYYIKARMLLLKKDKGWRVYAVKAVEILEKTTLISGHSSDHDSVLKELRGELDFF